METVDQVQSILEKAECLHSLDEINQALDRMAAGITAKYERRNPVIMCVMTGALITTGHLVTRLHFPLEIDYVHATRYRGAVRGGDLHWLVEPRVDLKGRNVIVVDDIFDGGLTLAAIIDYCEQAGAADVTSAVMVSKKREREPGVKLEPEFIGLETEDKFLFGFGLDYKEYLRNIPGIYAVNME